MPPKKNQQKMSLNDFLADESTGKTSWADEMDDLPMAPAPRDSSYRRGGDLLSSAPDRADRMGPSSFDRPERSYPPRDELPLPNKPPYTAFIGNISYDVTETEISDFFIPSTTVSVRVVMSQDGRPKGFGYVEFETLDGLKGALDKNGAQLANRTVRVSVAEAPKSGGDRGGFSSAADETSQWRRSGPLPPGPDTPPRGAYGARPERTGFGRSDTGPSGFDQMDVAGGARSGFGSKFQASAPVRDAPPRTPREPVEPSQGDVVTDWRTGKPVDGPSPHASRRPSGFVPQGEGRTPSFKRTDATDVDDKFASQDRMGFGSKFSPSATPPESPSNTKRAFGFGAGERRGSGVQTARSTDEPENWRAARKPASGSPTPAAAAAAPAERKRLELKPRNTEAAASAASAGSSSKSSPFGNAKPVDAAEREKQIEEKLVQKEKERQEELKVKKEKAKMEKEKVEKTRATSKVDKVEGEKAVPVDAEKVESAPQKARSLPPTGAWGGGRKPAGALAAEQAAAAKAAADASANGKAEDASADDAKVDEATKELEETKIDA